MHLLFLSDRQVRQKLFDLVSAAQRPLLVTLTQHGPTMREVPEREPFSTIERMLGDVVEQVVVVDEGKPDGMWRDPLGDLAEKLFPEDKAQAYAAATGYLLLDHGQPLAVLKRNARRQEDVEAVQDALHRAGFPVAPVPPKRRPPPEGAPKHEHSRERGRTAARPADATAPAPPLTLGAAYALLGVSPGTPLDEARRAFRALVAQYHPDKVAHLAPEFRALAEERTRALTSAWEQVSRDLR